MCAIATSRQLSGLPGPTESEQLQPAHRYFRLIPIALCLIYVVQCAWFIRTQSLTYDEPTHIAAGLEALRNRRFEIWDDHHPPLARLLFALPLRDSKWQIQIAPEDGFIVKAIAPNPESLAWRARSMNVLLGLTLAILFWFTARRLFSEAAANFGLALFAFSPALTAHFSLTTTDGAATLMTFATAVAVVYWRENPSTKRTVIAGVVLGLLLLAKFSTPIVFAVAMIWMVVPIRNAPWLRNIGKLALTVVIAAVVVWAGYFFHVSHLRMGDGQLTVTFPNRPDLTFKPVHTPVRLNLLVPAGEYIEGLRNVLRHNRRGQPAFFLGQVSSTGGWRFYFPTVIALKWPTVALALFLLAMGLIASRVIRPPTALWVMASFPALYFVISLFARFDIGDRHILPIYPFALLFVAGLWELARKRRIFMPLLIFAVVLQAADALRFAPDYLAYFTPLVDSSRSYTLLTDSNLDWGQGLIALRDYQRWHPDEQISLAYFGSMDPAMYGIHVHRLAEGERASGTVIVSATDLSGQYLKNPEGYRWVLNYPRVAILDRTLYVFRVR